MMMTMIKLLLVMMPWLDYTSSWTEAHRDLLSTFYFIHMTMTMTRMKMTMTMRFLRNILLCCSSGFSGWILRELSPDNFPRLSNLRFISTSGMPSREKRREATDIVLCFGDVFPKITAGLDSTKRKNCAVLHNSHSPCS